MRQLEKERDQGSVRRPGQKWTAGLWLEHWLENIARPHLRRSSYAAYRTAVVKHLIQGLGKHRLDRVEPEHLERLYRSMVDGGAKPATAHQAHRTRTLRTALGEAHRRGYVMRNVAALARPPRVQVEHVEPFTVEEVRAILDAAGRGRNEAGWAIALALGLRQGEVLALQWRDVDLKEGVLRIRATRLRPVYEHGCGGRCGKAPGYCPQRRALTEVTGDTKSDAGPG